MKEEVEKEKLRKKKKENGGEKKIKMTISLVKKMMYNQRFSQIMIIKIER